MSCMLGNVGMRVGYCQHCSAAAIELLLALLTTHCQSYYVCCCVGAGGEPAGAGGAQPGEPAVLVCFSSMGDFLQRHAAQQPTPALCGGSHAHKLAS